MIKFYIHVPELPGWQSLTVEFLEKIEASGLADSEHRQIILCLNGNEIAMRDFLSPLLDNSDSYTAVHVSDDSWRCEWPTLNYLKQQCDSSTDNDYIGYAHLKGLTKPNSKPVQDWKDYLVYWGIERWETSIAQLKAGYDTSSVNWFDNPWPHYSGNFWWATSDYIRRLEPLQDPATIDFGRAVSKYLKPYVILDPGNFRYEHEAWLGSVSANRYELHVGPNKTIDIDYHYHSEYPAENYRLK